MKINSKPKIKAFSLLETLVSITIIAVILLMLNNIILDFVIVSQKSLARSTIREELATASGKMVTDIRNADSLGNCSDSSCEIVSGSEPGIWQLCGTSICKIASGTIVYQTGANLVVNQFNINQGPVTNNNVTQNNVLITIVGSHQNANLNIVNVLRQVSVSTRNYGI